MFRPMRNLPPKKPSTTPPTPNVETIGQEFDKKNYKQVVSDCTTMIDSHMSESKQSHSLSNEQLAECYRLRARANVRLGTPDEECLSDYSQSILLLGAVSEAQDPQGKMRIKRINDYIARGHAYRRMGYPELALDDYALAKEIIQEMLTNITDPSIVKSLKDLRYMALYDEAVEYCQLGDQVNLFRAASNLEAIRDSGEADALKKLGSAAIESLVEKLKQKDIVVDLKSKKQKKFQIPLEVQEGFEKKEESAPMTAKNYCDRARAAMEGGDLSHNSLADCNRAINIDPNDAAAYFIKGNIYHLRLEGYMLEMEKFLRSSGTNCSPRGYFQNIHDRLSNAFLSIRDDNNRLSSCGKDKWLRDVKGFAVALIYNFEKALLITNISALKPRDKAKAHFALFAAKLYKCGEKKSDKNREMGELLHHYNEMCRFMPEGDETALKHKQCAIQWFVICFLKEMSSAEILQVIQTQIQDKETQIALLLKCLNKADPELGVKQRGLLSSHLAQQAEEALFSLDPEGAKRRLIELMPHYEMVGKDRPLDTVSDWLARAEGGLKIDDFCPSMIIGFCNKALTLDSNCAYAYYIRGICYLKLLHSQKNSSDGKAAINDFNKALAEPSTLKPLHQVIARHYLFNLEYPYGECLIQNCVKQYNEIMKFKDQLKSNEQFISVHKDTFQKLMDGLLKKKEAGDILSIIATISDVETRIELLSAACSIERELGKKLGPSGQQQAGELLHVAQKQKSVEAGEVKLHVGPGSGSLSQGSLFPSASPVGSSGAVASPEQASSSEKTQEGMGLSRRPSTGGG